MARRRGFAGTEAQHRRTAAMTAREVREEEHRVARHLREKNCPGALSAMLSLAYSRGMYHEERAWTPTKRVREAGARGGRLGKFQRQFKKVCAVRGV